MIDQIVELVREQSEGLEVGQSYPASTEILESLIGKGKQMQFQNRCNSRTDAIPEQLPELHKNACGNECRG